MFHRFFEASNRMRSTTAARIITLTLAMLTAVLRLTANLAGAFNFSPAGAVGLFGGSRLKSWQAYAIPIALMVGTDIALEIMTANPEYGVLHMSRVWVYGSYLLYVVIGRYLIGDSKNPFVIGGGAFLGSLQFFLVTNFFEWLMTDRYAQDWTGLVASYSAAFPFWRNTLGGDLIFAPAAFAAHMLLSRQPAPVAEEQLTSA